MRVAWWQSGHAADCKSAYAGSIPTQASMRVRVFARVAKRVDARDLKSLGRKAMWVRSPPRAPPPHLRRARPPLTVAEGSHGGGSIMIRVVLVDDHALVRSGFRLILSGQSDIEVVGEAGDAEEGLRLIRAQKPDVALLDVHMPGMSGIELTERVRRAELPTQIIILTVVDDARFPRRLLQSGALGYLTKACPADELLTAVRNVAQGRRYLDATIAREMALAAVHGESSPLESLSSRELEVALMLARGIAINEIAERLHLSPKTVSTYKQRLFEKLGVEHSIALAHLLGAHGMLEDGRKAPPALAGG